MASQKELVHKYILKYPTKSKRELARMLYEKYPTIFNSMEAARSRVRHYTLSNGTRARDQVMKSNSFVNKPVYNDARMIDAEEKLKDLLKTRKTPSTIEDISDYLDISPSKAKIVIGELEKKGYNIHTTQIGVSLHKDMPVKTTEIQLDVKKHSKNRYRFGTLGDMHLCSKYERRDVLDAMYDIFKEKGITTVYNTGNWIDGEARFNKTDIHTHGMDNQLQYMIDVYPNIPGITTYYVAGDDHEGWYTQREGINIGKYLEIKATKQGRTDLVFLGYMEADVILKAKNGQTKLRVLHPGGGSSYAVSYTSQKIVESYTGGDKPDIILMGHYHKAEYSYVRGVHVLQTASCVDQSPFMRKKRLASHLGGWIIEFSTDDNGAVTEFSQTFYPFYDKPYYKDNWSYKH
jgi:hypothetical protein